MDTVAEMEVQNSVIRLLRLLRNLDVCVRASGNLSSEEKEKLARLLAVGLILIRGFGIQGSQVPPNLASQVDLAIERCG